ncbi:neuromedin U receptor homolog nmur-2-like isoform X1 [Ciona intestinalis]
MSTNVVTALPERNMSLFEVSMSTSTNSTYEPPFDSIGIAISAAIIFTFLVFGVVGNSLTLAVIFTYKELNNNLFMRFIFSLCISDLLSALISWLFLYRRTWGFDVWDPIPAVFCKFYWATDIMTSYATALHVLSFAIVRFISVQYPVQYNKMKLMHANIWIVGIWVACIISGFIPSMFIFGAKARDRESSSPDSRWPSCTGNLADLDKYILYQKVAYPLFLYIPTIGVVITCILIAVTLKRRSGRANLNKKEERRLRKERQAVLQLILIIVSFLLGYIPFTAYEFWGANTHPRERYYFLVDNWFGMIEYFCLRFSECLNPVFYNLGSTKMRTYTKTFLKKKVFCCIKWQPTPPMSPTSNTRGNKTAVNTIANSVDGNLENTNDNNV